MSSKGINTAQSPGGLGPHVATLAPRRFRGSRLPAEPQGPRQRQGQLLESVLGPGPALRALSRQYYLDRTSRSSSADNSRSRVLLPLADPETPPSRSFSFSTLEEAAILPVVNNGACAVSGGRRGRGNGKRKEGSLRRRKRGPARAPSPFLEAH